MIRRFFKLLGRRKAGCYGRTAKPNAKRRANKAIRKLKGCEANTGLSRTRL